REATLGLGLREAYQQALRHRAGQLLGVRVDPYRDLVHGELMGWVVGSYQMWTRCGERSSRPVTPVAAERAAEYAGSRARWRNSSASCSPSWRRCNARLRSGSPVRVSRATPFSRWMATSAPLPRRSATCSTDGPPAAAMGTMPSRAWSQPRSSAAVGSV